MTKTKMEPCKKCGRSFRPIPGDSTKLCLQCKRSRDDDGKDKKK